MARAKYSNRELTNRLRELLAELHDTYLDDDGKAIMVTKGEALAALVMNHAIGWTEEVIEETDTPGQTKMRTVIHPPARWAIELIYERIEGKTPQALPDDRGGLTAADKVSEQALKKINQLTQESTEEKSDG